MMRAPSALSSQVVRLSCALARREKSFILQIMSQVQMFHSQCRNCPILAPAVAPNRSLATPLIRVVHLLGYSEDFVNFLLSIVVSKDELAVLAKFASSKLKEIKELEQNDPPEMQQRQEGSPLYSRHSWKELNMCVTFCSKWMA